MSQLPFLVVHGAFVTNVLVLAGGGLGVSAMWALRRRREAREIAHARGERPAVRLAALHPVRIATVGVLSAGIAYGVLWAVGSSLVSKAEKAGSSHLTAPPAGLVVAAALPHVREAALRELDHRYEHDMPRTDDVLAARFELAELVRGCSGRARLELSEERFEDALATALSCDSRDEEIDALAHLGRYREANELLAKHDAKSPRQAELVSIIAGDWARAARAADAMAQAPSESPAKTAVGHSYLDRDRCLAAWFRAKAGDAAAAKQLAVLAPDNISCNIARAMLLPPAGRRDALVAAAQSRDDNQRSGRLLAEQLAWVYGAADPGSRFDLYDNVRVLTGDATDDARIWLSPIATATHASDDTVSLLERGTLDVLRGDMSTAIARVAAARATGVVSPEGLDGVRTAILLHVPGAIAADPAVYSPQPSTAALLELRARGTASHELDLLSDDEGALARAIEASLAGDAATLAKAIATERPRWKADAGALLAIVPRLREHREQLAAVLHDFHGELSMDMDRMPFGMLGEAATRRDLAKLAGDEASAKHWQKLLDAQLPVLDDPEKVVALLLRQQL